MEFSCVIRIFASYRGSTKRHLGNTATAGYSKQKENVETKIQALSCPANV